MIDLLILWLSSTVSAVQLLGYPICLIRYQLCHIAISIKQYGIMIIQLIRIVKTLSYALPYSASFDINPAGSWILIFQSNLLKLAIKWQITSPEYSAYIISCDN